MFTELFFVKIYELFLFHNCSCFLSSSFFISSSCYWVVLSKIFWVLHDFWVILVFWAILVSWDHLVYWVVLCKIFWVLLIFCVFWFLLVYWVLLLSRYSDQAYHFCRACLALNWAGRAAVSGVGIRIRLIIFVELWIELVELLFQVQILHVNESGCYCHEYHTQVCNGHECLD